MVECRNPGPTENSTLFAGPWAMFGSTNSTSILPPNGTFGNIFQMRGSSSLYGMEAVWKIDVKDFPAFILVDDKGNDFFTNACAIALA